MRHRKKFNHLGRTTAHRKAMLSNMAVSLIKHKRIHTTLAKAKALKLFVEPLITKSKNDTTHSRRVVFGYLKDKEAVSILFREVSEKVANRPGGYTRILKTGNRLGDNAEMCFIELVDFNENMLSDSQSSKKSTRRRRSRKKDSVTEVKAQQVDKKDAVVDEVSESTENSEKDSVTKSAPTAKETEGSEDIKAKEDVEISTEEAKSDDAIEPEVKAETDKTSESKKDESKQQDAEEGDKEEDDSVKK